MPCLSERCAHGFVDGPVSGELARVGNVTDSNREFSDGHLLRGAFQSSWPPPPPKRIPPARGGCRVCSGSLRPAEGRPARRMRFVSGVGGLPAGLMRVENHGWIWGGWLRQPLAQRCIYFQHVWQHRLPLNPSRRTPIM